MGMLINESLKQHRQKELSSLTKYEQLCHEDK